MVRLADATRQAAFRERPNRFVVVLDDDGETLRAHLPNPGRLAEFLHPGTPFLVAPADGPDRKTRWDVVAARHAGTWVVLDTGAANAVVAEALRSGGLDQHLGRVEAFQAEPAHGAGRLDFAVRTDRGPVLVEVKSVTLRSEEGPVGLFPDAPTARGTRHVGELTRRVEAGGDAALVFVATRGDIDRIRPNRRTDPAFADALEAADAAGVGLFGFRTRFEPPSLRLGEPVPVEPVPARSDR